MTNISRQQNNILQLTDYLPDYPGNFGHTLIELAYQANQIKVHSFFVFPVQRKWHEQIKNAGGGIIYMTVYKFKDKSVDAKGTRDLIKIVKKNHIRIVHVQFGLSQKIISLLIKTRFPGIKIIWHWRGDIEKRKLPSKFFINAFYRFFGNLFVSYHITNSSYITERLITKKLIQSRKLYTFPNAINFTLFENSELSEVEKEQIEKIKMEYKTILLMIRNFRFRVDFDIILKTMYILKGNKDIVLLWIGYGESELFIRNKIHQMHLNNIILLGKRENVYSYYQNCHINIVAWEPWCNETINNTVYEALYCLKPVIGLNFGGLPKAFSKAEGVTTVPLSAEKYAEAILDIRQQYEKNVDFAIAGKKKVVDTYNVQSYVAKLIQLYYSSNLFNG